MLRYCAGSTRWPSRLAGAGSRGQAILVGRGPAWARPDTPRHAAGGCCMRSRQSVRPVVPGCGRLAAGGLQLIVQPFECHRRTVVGPQPQYQPPTVFDQAPSPVDQLLQHRLQPPALGRVAHGCLNKHGPASPARRAPVWSVAGTRGPMALRQSASLTGLQIARTHLAPCRPR